MRQEDPAERLGMPHNLVSNVKLKERPQSLPEARRIEEDLGMPIASLRKRLRTETRVASSGRKGGLCPRKSTFVSKANRTVPPAWVP